jgi:hypothetical protein
LPPARHFPFAQQALEHAPHASACLQLFLTVPQRPLQVLALDSDWQMVMVLLDLLRPRLPSLLLPSLPSLPPGPT